MLRHTLKGSKYVLYRFATTLIGLYIYDEARKTKDWIDGKFSSEDSPRYRDKDYIAERKKYSFFKAMPPSGYASARPSSQSRKY